MPWARGLALLTAIIPVRNGAHFIEQALDSVFAQPEVTEVIVVDDGSVDDSAAKAARFSGVTVVQQPALGPGAARNAGVRRASQPFLGFLDVDDLWLPGKSRLQLAALPESSRAYASSAFEYFLPANTALPAAARSDWLEHIQRGAIPSTLLIARGLFWEVGAFDERLPTAEDVDWLFRAEAAGVRRVLVDRVLVKKRLHDCNTSLNVPGNTQRLFELVQARCRRRTPSPVKQ